MIPLFFAYFVSILYQNRRMNILDESSSVIVHPAFISKMHIELLVNDGRNRELRVVNEEDATI